MTVSKVCTLRSGYDISNPITCRSINASSRDNSTYFDNLILRFQVVLRMQYVAVRDDSVDVGCSKSSGCASGMGQGSSLVCEVKFDISRRYNCMNDKESIGRFLI